MLPAASLTLEVAQKVLHASQMEAPLTDSGTRCGNDLTFYLSIRGN